MITNEQIIALIRSFNFTVEFFHWLQLDGQQAKNLLERVENNVYERIGECSIHGTRVYSFGGKLDLTKISHFYDQSVHEEKDLFTCLWSNLNQFEKKIIEEVITDNHYTILSECIYKTQVYGSWWEIYELPELARSIEKLEHVRNHLEIA
ncbi:MAG: hypothetical protein JSR58_03020 [Verrucomicrobia bacterium]|nr:hypothetical protein [Verrucomicrobiota bacterium]